MSEESKVCAEGKIWDLHIHSNQCESYAGNNKDKPIDEYVNDLVNLFSDFPNLEMVSFTDHNHISSELYQEAIARDDFPNLLPGVEVDVQLAEGEPSKHLVVYFDAVNNDEKIKVLSGRLNHYFDANNVGPKNPVPIDSFLNMLLELRIPFTW